MAESGKMSGLQGMGIHRELLGWVLLQEMGMPFLRSCRFLCVFGVLLIFRKHSLQDAYTVF